MSVDIVVTKRSDDYHACLADNSAVWDCGKSQAEAVGKLIMSATKLLGICILVDVEEKKKRKK